MSYSYHGSRALLNLPGHESTAAIVAEVEDTTGWPEGTDRGGKPLTDWNSHPTILLQFANCDRSIAFEFSLADADARRNTFHKVDTMIDALTQFREGLIVESRMYKRRAKIVADNKKEK